MTQESNPHLSCLLHWQVDSLLLSHQRSSLNLFPGVCIEAAGVPGLETGQQYPPQSGSALADKVLTQPHGTDSGSTGI